MIVARKPQPHGDFHDREGFSTDSGTNSFAIMVNARNVSMRGPGITGHNGIGSRDRLGSERHTQPIAIRVAAYAGLARGGDDDQ
jgi:hypothetical protein